MIVVNIDFIRMEVKNMMKIVNQGFKFVGISGIGWILDFIIFNILVGLFGLNISLSNFLSSLVGVTFVFIFSTRKIFENKILIDIRIKYVIYVIYQIVLIFCASKIVLFINNIFVDYNFIVNYAYIMAKILITPFTLLINFIVMKFLLEKI